MEKKLQLCSLYSQVNDTTLIWILYVKLCRVFDAGTFAVKFIQILNSMSNSCIIALSTVEEIFPNDKVIKASGRITWRVYIVGNKNGFLKKCDQTGS